ncbi:VID27-domain-containing protein [Acaromyces ingoldii]|uniref:VID27-domain-containing protein n=1 Tax=Acaromyces ingoldii TaxID=215250 RepID=A0A316YBB2_9BASI|nr:VID27-domain-containing protein [Acaromyces ingoldii]PWN86561.1 VID27-domain-containing protein [Acaromyces ingoldii]
MFMLKSLFGKIWSDQNNAELIQLPAGALYLVRPGSIKGARECIYKDAVATIRRTTTEFNYQLVITRAYEEGEEQLLEEDDESDDERSFLIDASLNLRTSTTSEGEPAFAWRDLDGDVDDLLEFVMDGAQVNTVTRSIFEVTFLQCAYERKFGRSHEEASDEDLEALKYKGAGAGAEAGAEEASGKQSRDVADELEQLSVKEEKKTPGKKKAPKEKPAVPAAFTDEVPAPPGEEKALAVLEATADLYLYDQSTGLFMTQDKAVDVRVLEAGRFLYWLAITSPTRQWLSQRLEPSMNTNFAADNLSVVWNYFDTERRCYSWLLRFSDKAHYEAYQTAFARLMWQTLNEENFERANKGAADQRYISEAYEEDVPMEGVEEEDEGDESETERIRRDDDEQEVADELEAHDAEEEEEEGDVDAQLGDGPERMPVVAGETERNSQLTVGYKFDRSFVIRGNRIGVFKHTEDDQLEFATTINSVATPKGKLFNPRKAMLHDQDSAMVMMDPSNQHALYKMDLEYGKIVDEWKVHDDVEVANVVPDSKYAQMTPQQTLIGHSHNSVYRIDPRLAGQKLVDAQFKQYTAKNDFSAATTDDRGRLAVASNKGDIRLFDQIGKNAKTALPALGDPIIGVDVTADGRYVVATCKTYLLLIDTLIGDGRYKGSLGFDRAFPADSKPIPRRLQLKPHHVAYMDQEVSFTPARFDTPAGSGETSIVSATGSYIVSWPLERVKKGRTDGYTLRKLADTVVEDNFAFGSSNNIIVAMPQDLQMHRKQQLKKPTRTSLTTTPRESRSSIVDERY